MNIRSLILTGILVIPVWISLLFLTFLISEIPEMGFTISLVYAIVISFAVAKAIRAEAMI